MVLLNSEHCEPDAGRNCPGGASRHRNGRGRRGQAGFGNASLFDKRRAGECNKIPVSRGERWRTLRVGRGASAAVEPGSPSPSRPVWILILR